MASFGFGTGNNNVGGNAQTPTFSFGAPTGAPASGTPASSIFSTGGGGATVPAFNFSGGSNANNNGSSSSKPAAMESPMPFAGFGTKSPAPVATENSQPTTPATSFNFNGGAPAPASSGNTTPAPSAGFSFGAAPSSAASTSVPTDLTTESSSSSNKGAEGFNFGATFASTSTPVTDAKPAAPVFGGLGGSNSNTPAPATKPGSATATEPGGDTQASRSSTRGLESAADSAPETVGNEGKKPALTPPAPAFSFGKDQGTGSSSTPAPFAGGFTFSGAKSPSTPAPVGTPQTSTNNNTAIAATGTHATATPETQQAPTTTNSTVIAKEPSALEYQTLTVEQILNKFQKELEEDSLRFVEEAKRVCDYDAILRDSQRDIARLFTEAQRLVAEQDQIENKIDGIDAFQRHIEQTLVQVEQQVDQIFQTQSHLIPQDADHERERAYDTANAIEDRLDNVATCLRLISDQMSIVNASAYDVETQDIVKMLNENEDALTELEAKAQKLDLDSNEVIRMLGKTPF